MEQKSIMGASLEVLAPYLPYGIEVEYVAESDVFSCDKGERSRLISLNWFGSLRARLQLVNDVRIWVPVTEVLPVLKPFLALCDPLPDGTVPLIEVAKAFVYFPGHDDPCAAMPDWTTATAHIRGEVGELREAHVHWVYREMDSEETYNGCFIINENWAGYELTEEGKEIAGPALHVLLRRYHFAVGLEPHQYISAAPPAAPVAAAPAGKGGAGV